MLALQLGGLIIKAGQFASSRLDVLPETITIELESLQDEVKPAEYELIKRQIDQCGDALGAALGELGGIAGHLQLVHGAHRRGPAHIHSVWKLPG